MESADKQFAELDARITALQLIVGIISHHLPDAAWKEIAELPQGYEAIGLASALPDDALALVQKELALFVTAFRP